MKYERLNHIEFGEYLLNRQDLDPVYIGLQGLEFSPGHLASWLLSYWCFYHAGVSCALTESHNYWDDMIDFAGRKAAPRGIERRHFRGQKAVDAVAYLMHRYRSPINAIEDLVSGDKTFADISSRVQQWPLFGPWISFKVADMLERCAGIEVDFTNCELSMYSEPTKGALLIAEQEGWLADIGLVVQNLLEIHMGRLAPPDYSRPINIQEIETILCKFKSHWNGHYPLGKDTRELGDTLDKGWGLMAERMRDCLPKLSSLPAEEPIIKLR